MILVKVKNKIIFYLRAEHTKRSAASDGGGRIL